MTDEEWARIARVSLGVEPKATIPRPPRPEHPAAPDVRGLYQLVHQLDVAIDTHDRDRALELLNRLRELARHAFAVVQNYRRTDG
jgi:hypothetical protein